jgi:hypothetical protein
VQWIEEHYDNPYPNKSEKKQLAAMSGTTLRQLNDWFANARRNIKKLGYQTWRKKKMLPPMTSSNSSGSTGNNSRYHHLNHKIFRLPQSAASAAPNMLQIPKLSHRHFGVTPTPNIYCPLTPHDAAINGGPYATSTKLHHLSTHHQQSFTQYPPYQPYSTNMYQWGVAGQAHAPPTHSYSMQMGYGSCSPTQSNTVPLSWPPSVFSYTDRWMTTNISGSVGQHISSSHCQGASYVNSSNVKDETSSSD